MLEHLRIALRLSARNRLALLCGVFPVILLLSFLVLHRVEDPPLTPTNAVGRPTEVRGPAPPRSDANAPLSVNLPESATASRVAVAIAKAVARAAIRTGVARRVRKSSAAIVGEFA